MIPNKMPVDELEEVYDLVAEAIDAAGADRESLFLTKLVLILAGQAGSVSLVADAVTAARRDLH